MFSDQQTAAARAVEDIFRCHSGEAAAIIIQLDDDELSQVELAAKDRRTARDAIKAIQARAYDRRQRIGEEACKAELARRQLVVAARRVLERELEMTVEASVDTTALMTDGELQAVSSFLDQGDVTQQVERILHGVKSRLSIAESGPNAEPDFPLSAFQPPIFSAAEAATDVTTGEEEIDEPTELADEPARPKSKKKR